jgi:BioD-like phosphotransacetylase family protein|tara:strand:- start:3740 stop:4699 length:960 start_codon:yes stop_codon:yes gene_type:complete
MGVLYITSQKQNSGKTTLSVALASLLIDRGKVIDIAKPFSENGTLEEGDRFNLSKLLDRDYSLQNEQSLDAVIASIKESSSKHEFVIVEALSSMPVEEQVSFVEEIKAQSLIVSIPSTMDSDADFSSRFGSSVCGVVLNQVSKYAQIQTEHIMQQNLSSHDVLLLGTIPEDRTLLSLSVAQICENLSGQMFGEVQNSESLVEHFMVGGFGMDPGEYSFATRDKKAVVVRGDRPDVQMSALNTDMECFIMTNGMDPIEYIKYEAVEEGVSIMIVQSDTLDTMENISKLQQLAEFDHPDKLSKAKELVSDYVNVEQLLSKS